jgi:hypothetical protein
MVPGGVYPAYAWQVPQGGNPLPPYQKVISNKTNRKISSNGYFFLKPPQQQED